jgi:hypothetical protein
VKKKKEKKGNWVVTVRCVVLKELYLTNCTRKEAEEKPNEHADQEAELEWIDWKVIGIMEN